MQQRHNLSDAFLDADVKKCIVILCFSPSAAEAPLSFALAESTSDAV